MEREQYLQMNVIIFGCLTVLAISSLTQSVEFSSFTFTREPSDAVVAPGSSVTIHCTIRSDSTPIIEWLNNDLPVPLSNQRFTKFSNGSLRIRSLHGEPSVSGRYSCQVEDQASTILLISRKAVVSVARLILASDPADVSDVYTGDNVRFECPAEGKGPLEFVWQKNRRDIDFTEERVHARFRQLPSGTLEIQDVRSYDEGSYRCFVTSPYNLQEISKKAYLILRRGSPSGFRPFEFTKFLETSMQSTVGSPVILEVFTSQPATFRWYKNDDEISLRGDHYTLVGQGSLYIKELQEIHTAIYRVVAEAMDGSQIESSTSVLALVPPSFTVTPVNKAAREGDTVVLPCRTYGIPNPTVVWLNDGDPIQIGNAFKIVQGDSLNIDSALIGDSGFYQCVATNDVGNIQGSMELLVLGPGTPSGPVPSMPVRTSVSRVSARTAFVNWDPPRTTNGEIIQYRISLQAVNDPSIRTRIISVTGETSKLIADLTPDTEYSLQILARNDNGLGESSDPINFIIREAVPSSPPTDLSVHSFENSSSLLLMWNAPKDTHGVIKGYVIYYTSDQTALLADWDQVPHNSNLTTATLDGLEGRTTYYVRVQGRNGVELGPISLIVPATTGAGTQLPPVPGAGMAGFPWCPWLIAVALFVLILALVFLLLLCALCNCFKRFPCCSDFCGVVGCFDQCYKSLDRCCASCCPCYCSDEDERAGTAISGGSDMLACSKIEKEMDVTSHQ